jgi:serine/threonine protein kinase/WD40 repeat protein
VDNIAAVESIFLAALDKNSPEEQAAYLDQACGHDPELRASIERLLRAEPRVGHFLQAPAAGLVATAQELRLAERPGTRIGPYKLLQQIGEGGMGVVYMADQEQPVKRRVALKIIKPGLDSGPVVARFEAERQALAMMDHQNIARVLDAGTTDSGRPYFVMELVHGIPITKFCDDNRLTPRERLDLFVPVCQAIQHAHQKGIIHRDVKPSNVLVTMYDDKPVPKVIDFGVAKAIEQRLTERTLFTQFGALVGTFEYMSPEQAEMNAFGVDTRSDVYSLGVLLYELLTGSTPLERKRLREAALDELVRLIREEEPPRPSVRLSTSDTLAKVAAARKTEPARLSKLVRGEIDWIVMKCLEKDRGRRYETASALARDVERYLRDEPVEACPPSAGYRLRKVVRKHRGPIMIAAGFALLLVAGVAVSTWQAVRATAARRQADANSEAAGEARREAVAKREEAESARQSLRRALYASDMQLAQSAWDSGNAPHVLDLLRGQRPAPGEDDLRGLEWHYWDRRCRTEFRTVTLPFGMGRGAMSADGTRHVVAVRGRAVEGSTAKEVELRVWDTTAAKELPALRPYPGESPRTIFGPDGLSRDGRRVVFLGYFIGPDGREERRLKVLDCDTGRELLALSDLPVPSRPAFDRTGNLLALWVEPPDKPAEGRLVIRDLVAGKELRSIPLADASAGVGLTSLDFSPDGTRLAVLTHPAGSQDREAAGEVRVWETHSGKEVLRFPTGPGAFLGSLAYSPDGKRLAVVGEKESSLKLRDAATGELLLELTDQVGTFMKFAFSPDGARLAGASEDGKVRIWDVAGEGPKGRRAPARVLQGVGAPVRELAFSADGRHISAAGMGGTVLVWEVVVREPRVVVRQPGGQLSATAAAAASARFAAAWDAPERKTEIKVWDAAGQQLFAVTDVRPTEDSFLDQRLRLSADGTRLAYSTVDRRHAAEKRIDVGRLSVWDVASGREIFHRASEEGGLVLAAFSPDGRRVATSRLTDSDGITAMTSRVSVWDLAANTEVLGLDLPGFATLGFSPDGGRLAASVVSSGLEPFENELRVWDAATGAELMRRPGFGGWTGEPAFDGDGKRLAVTVAEKGGKVIHLLDAGNGEELCAPLKGHQADVGSMAFSPDGRRLASAGGAWRIPTSEVTVWDVASGRALLTLPTKGVGCLAFSPDGRRLSWVGGLIEGTDVEVLVWDATPLPE